MNRQSLSALLYMGLCLALCLAGVQLVVAAGAQDRSPLTPMSDDAELVAHVQSTPQTDPGTAEAQPGVQLVAAFDDRIVLAVSAADPTITTIELPDGSTCQEISLAGFQSIAESGDPALPAANAALGIPVAADPEVRIVDSEYIQLPGVYNLCPEPTAIVDESAADELSSAVTGWQRVRNADVYGTNAWIPAEVVEIVSTGFMRDQRIAEVAIRPLQYNPVSGEIRLYTTIAVEVQLNADPSSSLTSQTATPQASSQAFDTLLRGYLLNYSQAAAWRLSSSVSGDVAADDTIGAAVTGTPVYRLEIEKAGLYRLSYADLQAADPSVDLSSVDPRTFHLSTHGQEVAIEVTGQDDGSFDAGDAITFYAEAINTVYADINVYWLTWDEAQGFRMVTLDATPTGGNAVPAYFTTTMHLEEDHLYRRSLVTADGDNWFWSQLIDTGVPTTTTYTFELPNPAESPFSATLRGDLLGYAAVTTTHSAEVHLNGHRIYTATWDSQTEHLFEATFPQVYLATGANALSVTIGINNGNDYVLVNRFALTYTTHYTAANNQLWFDGDHAGTWEFRVGGFTTDAVKILDITAPMTPSLIAGGPARIDGLAYTLPFSQSLNGERHYLAVATALAQSPLSVSRDVLSDLHNTTNTADYIVITHGSLITSAQVLADYRTAQGLRTMVVDVQDVYDEFNYGITDAAAIHSFLAYAYTYWTPPAPAYVVLFGDGHYDAKDNLGRGSLSLIPPYLAPVDPWIRETAADNRYVTVDGDDLPDMFLGRLPANTLAEATVLVNKIIAYEQTTTSGTWQEKLLFAADNDDGAGDFPGYSDVVADSYVPAPYAVDKVYLGVAPYVHKDMRYAVVTATTAIRSAINEGRLIVNYVGHGAVQRWAGEKLLSLDSVPYLNNTDKLPFFVAMTCLEGHYILPPTVDTNNAALAEIMVRLPTGGSIASWSPTGEGLASGHDYLNRGLFEAIFAKDIIELGAATTYAKQYLAADSNAIWFHDLLDTYILFGDPALRLNVLPVDLQITKEVAGRQAGFKSGTPITYTLTYTNTGPATAHNVTISDTGVAVLSSPTWTATGTAITAQVGSTYVWEVADMPAGARGVITVTGTIPFIFAGPLSNAASIATTSQETNTLNNNSQVTVQVAQVTTDLKLSSFTVEGGLASPALLRPGDAVTYTLTFANTGPDIARDVILTDTLPAIVTHPAVISAGVPITQLGATPFAWSVADLAPNMQGTLTITGIISRSLYTGLLTNVATISTASVDTEIANNTASATIMVSPYRVYIPLVIRSSR